MPRLIEAPVQVARRPGEWVRYSTPGAEGADYVSICVPAFSFDLVHRDPQ